MKLNCLPILNVGMRGYVISIPSILYDGNTVAWFDAKSEYITMNGSLQISQWNDKSGMNHHLLQNGADSIKPIWSADGLLFDGVDDFLKCVAFTLVRPEQIHIVFKQITWTLNGCVYDGNATSSMALAQQSSAPNLAIYANAALGLEPLTLDTFGIVRTLFNGANSKIQVNDDTPATGNAGSANGSGFTLGARGGDDRWSHIQVKEIIIRKVEDSAGDEAIIYNYLKNKYSI